YRRTIQIWRCRSIRYQKRPWLVLLRQVHTERPYEDTVDVVIDRSKMERLTGADVGQCDSEGAGGPGVQQQLTDELPARGEINDLPRLVGVGIDGIAIANDEVPIGRQYQSKRPMQVNLILVDHAAPTVTLFNLARVHHGEDLVVSRGRNV